jgi:hypothetical protein
VTCMLLLALALTAAHSGELSPMLVRDLSAYRACIDHSVSLLDHGQADEAMVAKSVAQRCVGAYRDFVNAAIHAAKSGGGPVGVARNFDMALFAVHKERRAMSAPNSN